MISSFWIRYQVGRPRRADDRHRPLAGSGPTAQDGRPVLWYAMLLIIVVGHIAMYYLFYSILYDAIVWRAIIVHHVLI